MRQLAKHTPLYSPSTPLDRPDLGLDLGPDLARPGAMLHSDDETLAWHICEDDREWSDVTRRQSTLHHARANIHDDSSPHPRKYIFPRAYTPVAGILLVLVALFSWRMWRRAHVGLAAVETELETVVMQELWRDRVLGGSATTAEESLLHPIENAANLDETITEVVLRDLGRDWAVVEVTIQPTAEGPTFRQTRLYQEADGGWVRTDIVSMRWGETREFESDHFVWVYRGLDENAVMANVRRLDALYPELQNSLLVQLPTDTKPTILVDPAMRPGIIFPYNDARADMVVASPATALVPVDLAPGDVLLQSVVIQAYDRFEPTAKVDLDSPVLVYRLRNGHRLWLIWKHELPLAMWREPLVRLAIAASKADMPQATVDMPSLAQDLCAYHAVWMTSPLDVGVPIRCRPTNGKKPATTWFEHPISSGISLEWLIYGVSGYYVPLDFWQERMQAEPSPAAIMLATMFEYVADTYGEDAVSRLLAEIPAHERVETLIPAVFDVPLPEFMDGWRTFLVEHY